MGTFELYYPRSHICRPCLFFFFSSCVLLRQCATRTSSTKKRTKKKIFKKKKLVFFFFGSWSQPTLLQLLALHFHGRLDRINRPLYILSELGWAWHRSSLICRRPHWFFLRNKTKQKIKKKRNITSVALSLSRLQHTHTSINVGYIHINKYIYISIHTVVVVIGSLEPFTAGCIKRERDLTIYLSRCCRATTKQNPLSLFYFFFFFYLTLRQPGTCVSLLRFGLSKNFFFFFFTFSL